MGDRKKVTFENVKSRAKYFSCYLAYVILVCFFNTKTYNNIDKSCHSEDLF